MYLVQTLSKLNVLLIEEQSTWPSESELAVLRWVLPSPWFTKVELWLRLGRANKVIHRTTLVGLVNCVLVGPGDTTGTLTVRGNEKLLGPIMLAVNQESWERYEERKRLATDQSAKLRVLHAEMLRDAFYAQVSEPYAHALGRMWMICQHGFPAAAAAKRGRPFAFLSEFEARLQFPFGAMLALGFALLTHYSAEDNTRLFSDPLQFVTRPESLHSILRDEHRQLAERIFDFLSLPWDEHVRRARRWADRAPTEQMYQLFELYEHPLVRLPSGIAFVLDAYFLQQRVTEGAYWALFNSLKADDKEGPLREAFGHATEWYVSELLRRTYAPTDERRLWLGWDGDFVSREGNLPDAVIREDDVLYFLEVTTSSLYASEMASGDPDIVESGLRRVWLGAKEGGSSKLPQLAGAIRSFRAGHLTLPNLPLDRTYKIVPVLANLRLLPQWPGAVGWYRQIMRDGGLEQLFVDDLLILDLRELEEVAELELEGVSLTDILERRRRFKHPETAIHNLLAMSDLLAGNRHPLLDQGANEAASSFRRWMRE